MKRAIALLLCVIISLTLLNDAYAQTEHHRATHLGNPATRFAPPLSTPEDLRARFADEKLKPDITEILWQWDWTGNVDDLCNAAQTNEIEDITIAIGETMPFMSSRKNGRPVCLRNVLWAGDEPAPAYAFNFTSKGRLYRCITPKACSNFFVVDLGPAPKPQLIIECTAPDEVPAGRPVQVCLNVRNIGNAAEPAATVTLPVPQGVLVTGTSEGGIATNGIVTWEIPNLPAGAAQQVCAKFAMRQLGMLPFAANAKGAQTFAVHSSCATKIIGIPAILLEVVDIEDPIEVGKEVNYDIKVTNQGTAVGTNIRVICTLPASQEFVSGSGTSAVKAEDRTLSMEAVPELAPKAVASWRIVVKALQADDLRFKVELTSDQFQNAITEDESTQQY